MRTIKNIFIILVLLFATINAQSTMDLTLKGNYISPIGDLGDLYSSGFGGTIGAAYNLSDSWAVGLSVGYLSLNADNDYWSKIISEAMGQDVSIEADIPYTIVPVMIDAYYYFSKSTFQPYLTISLGMHMAKTEANSITVNGTQQNIGLSESKTVSGYKVGAGFIYKFSPKIGLNVSATFDGNSLEFAQSSTTTSGSVTTTNSSNTTTAYFDIAAGVSIAL